MKVKTGVLACDVQGHFTKWKKGTRVKAIWRGNRYDIEREKRVPAGILKEGLPLMNELTGVKHNWIILDP